MLRIYRSFKSSNPITKNIKNIFTTTEKIILLLGGNVRYKEYICFCPKNDKISNKLSLINNQPETQLERQVNTILYSRGGRIQYGNFLTDGTLMAYLEERRNNPNAFANERVNFNGNFEGQPGGMRGPLRNRF
jgi:hypothetical protein